MIISRILPNTSPRKSTNNQSQNLTSFNGNKNKQVSFSGKWTPYEYSVTSLVFVGTNGETEWDHSQGNIGKYRPYSWETTPTVTIDDCLNHILKSNHSDFEEIKPDGYIDGNAELGEILTREESLFDQVEKLKGKVSALESKRPNPYNPGLMDELFETKAYKNYTEVMNKKNKMNQEITELTSKIDWITAEAETLKKERLKGTLIDISLQDLPEANSLMEMFLKKAKANPSDTRWVEGKLVATPTATKRASDIVLEAHGFAEREVNALSLESQKRTISLFLEKSNFVETVMRHVAKIVKI